MKALPGFVREQDELDNDGERQIGKTLGQIAPDHRKRYEFAAESLVKELGEGIRVLDACSGNGYGSYILAEAGCLVTSIEKHSGAVTFAKLYWAHGNIEYRQGDIEKNALDQYDAVVCFEAFEHLNAKLVISRFKQAAPILWASVPNETTVPHSLETHPFHLRHYTPDDFEALLVGYRIDGWWTQYNKWNGDISEGNDGRTLIVKATGNEPTVS